MNSEISQLSIKELLNSGDDYIIPMYQRNYAWDEGEITQLIQDILDYMPTKEFDEKNYYIGTLVVFDRQESKRVVYETIDGQQRLTTLSLLASYLKNMNEVDLSWYEKLCIHFESRENSSRTFEAIFKAKIETLKENEINTAILNGYRLVQKILPLKLKENNVSTQAFTRYLFEKVQIMRVKVPSDTDLNHYFEIMNNRGEQLEKHEILKAKMMEVLNGIIDITEREESKNCLHWVWEACANMEKYVQMGFTPEQRHEIFGKNDWGQFNVDNFDELCKKLPLSTKAVSRSIVEQSLNEIIMQAKVMAENNDNIDESPERFNTVINFPNFLLHVLRVLSKKDIPLDDKKLISIFEDRVLKSDKAIERVKKFTFALLRCKYLFDQYVIKREFIKGTDGWSLRRCKWNDGGEKSKLGRSSYVNTFGGDDTNSGDNHRILMLLSAFHVSTPTLVYKHWLNASLYHLYYAEEIEAKSYLKYLESVATAFVFDRFLGSDGGSDYFDIIYNKQGVCQSRKEMISEECLKSRLSFSNIENNLVFNYLDYLLWLKYKSSDPIVSAYEFTFRSSVEHYYPQTPMPGHSSLPPDLLNSFGNLCLISHSKNSRLSNFMPEAKKEYYQNNIDSIKQRLMMKSKHWDAKTIVEHYEEMKKVLVMGSVNDISVENTS